MADAEAGAEAAVGAGVEPAAGPLGLDELAGEARRSRRRRRSRPRRRPAGGPARRRSGPGGSGRPRRRAARRRARPRRLTVVLQVGRPRRTSRAGGRACSSAARAGRRGPSVRSPDADAGEVGVAGDLAGRVGDVHDLGAGWRRPCRRRRRTRAGSPAGVPTTITRSAPPSACAARLGDQQRVPAGDDAAAHAVGDRGDAERLDEPQRGLLGAVGPDVGAEDQHRRAARGEQLGDLGDRVGVGRDAAARGPTAGSGPGGGVEELVHRDVDERRAAVRGAGDGERLVHAVERRRPRCGWCAPSFVTGARIGGWSSSWRLPLPQRLAGARPPTTTIGEPANWACAIALTPLVTPGPAVSTARPGVRVSLPVASAAKAAVCSWRTSSSRIGGSALTAPSYIGKTWAPDSVNIVSTPWARATATACSPAWPVELVGGVLGGGVVGHRRGVCVMDAGYLQLIGSPGLQVDGFVPPQRLDQRQQQVGADGGRLAARAPAAGAARAGTPGRCR